MAKYKINETLYSISRFRLSLSPIMKSMQKIIVLSLMFLLLSIANVLGQNKVEWINIEEAQNKNALSEKYLIVDFTAEWCGWCKKMDATTFSDQKVIDLLNSEFYPVKMDFESGKVFSFDGKKYTAKEFAKKMEVPGLPTMLVISPDYKSVDTIVGYQKSKPFLQSLNEYLK